MRRLLVAGILLTAGILLLWAHINDYELRFVPNRLGFRPPTYPSRSPDEITEHFELAGGSERDNRGFPQRKIDDLSSRFPKLFYREGPRNVRLVALTFDDGPDSVYTPQILDVLKQHNVKATFFLIGKRAELFPGVVKRMVREGHVVGNHTWSHPNIMKMDNKAMVQEIMKAEEVLSKLAGYRPALFRSPYGSIDEARVKEIEKLNYKIVAWNVDSLDWKSLTAEQVRANILENVREGSIILQHSAGSKEENLAGSVAALEDVIVTLKKEGYRFVTVPELLKLPYKK
ncbi:polysaccharide deacetylase family protein [Thermosediminibacter litoriperuensis]|uniref:Peptidoglycan/xylan/chitin deacetylase (PgdA/CDA1 family) n=1 Tax=Thermosediminibacter litoriperuensis TaxID=291989 RepID=A0A5S5AYF0_9FIRM|nr:polysaccharide deacetylase family protein [Thermosediminibacter litoriperuensis]TYP57384.1 peptidoglycan/xylan/chitin deacetylase (PgdA/CDA1 family) [Thermosediminibacter litoriperuensis]